MSAIDDEMHSTLPGDDLIPDAGVTSTRGITIRRTPDRVWPWIAQLGQRRGGFYSYDWLENLVGCQIHNADRIVPEWQHPQVGDDVQLAHEVQLTIAVLDPGRALVLQGGMPPGRTPLLDFTWAFSLREEQDGTTRLLVRGALRLPALVGALDRCSDCTDQFRDESKDAGWHPRPGRTPPGWLIGR